tara:strand:- start:210 stop:854 length:645 start_codon:yes stop_codon:yes gene_type:complete
MANKNITFDPNAGVSYGANVTINTGATFEETFKVKNTDKTNFDFTGYSGSSQMRKSIGTGSTTVAAATFTVGFTSAAAGEFKISLDADGTNGLSGGRYDYDILVKAGGATDTILNTGVAVGHTVGVGSVNFIVNKVTDVAVGDSMSVGSVLEDIYVTGVAVTTSTVTIGSAHTHSAEILPGTAVTFTRAGTAASTYRIASGNVLVLSGVSSAPS